MQYCKINSKVVQHVFDKSSLKQNCYTPSTNIKISNPKNLNKTKNKLSFNTFLEHKKRNY